MLQAQASVTLPGSHGVEGPPEPASYTLSSAWGSAEVPDPLSGKRVSTPGTSRVLPVRGLGQDGRPSPACGIHTGLWRSPRTRRLALPGETQTVVRRKARKGPYKHGLHVFMGAPQVWEKLGVCRAVMASNHIREPMELGRGLETQDRACG